MKQAVHFAQLGSRNSDSNFSHLPGVQYFLHTLSISRRREIDLKQNCLIFGRLTICNGFVAKLPEIRNRTDKKRS